MKYSTRIKSLEKNYGINNGYHFLQLTGRVTEWDSEKLGHHTCLTVPDISYKDDPITFQEALTGKTVSLEYIQNLVSQGQDCFSVLGNFDGV
jgi:hypothetical protein